MFKMEWNVKKAAWLSNPNLRWKAGLDEAGLQFRQRLQRQNYPPPPPLSTYVRTGTLANKAGFRIYETYSTIIMLFGSTFYLPYLIDDVKGPPNWADKKQELVDYMTAGFKKGVKNYKE